MEERYRKFSTYLKGRFGQRVHKVSIDAGFSCPNRDGKISKDACIYCDNRAFSLQSRSESPDSLEAQIRQGIDAAKKRFGAKRFIIYFQAYTNTYASPDLLKQRYDTIRRFDDTVGLSIATRPDSVDEEVLEVIDSYTADYEVWIEYGLQSMHNKTLEFINRGHRYEDFLKAVELTRRYSIKICAHVILGLPFETREMMIETAKAIAGLNIEGIKIHPLHVVKDTRLAVMFLDDKYKPLRFDEYVDGLADFIAHLPPEMIIQRFGADCPADILLAPTWINDKNRLKIAFENKLIEKGYYQGIIISNKHQKVQER